MNRRSFIGGSIGARPFPMPRLALMTVLAFTATLSAEVGPTRTRLFLSCPGSHEFHRVLLENGVSVERYDSPEAAMSAASAGASVMILAPDYPERPTQIKAALFAEAKSKGLRLYVEFPAELPGFQVGKVEGNRFQRGMVASDFFHPALPKLRILGINGLRYVRVLNPPQPDLAAARVAGFDAAVYGFPAASDPLLFRHPDGNMLVATTALSRFVTGRYGPAEAWGVLWNRVLQWLLAGDRLPELKWDPMVRTTYRRNEELPPRRREAGARARGGVVPAALWAYQQTGDEVFLPPRTNEEYGLNEASLIQQEGDPVADLLYTVNFAFLGLHEAASATKDPAWMRAEDKLAGFLVRIQVRSQARPELDGGWFRAFDMKRWEAWGSNADAGWCAWAIESGWTQGWITSVLAMRQLKTSLWELTAGSGIEKHFANWRVRMLPARSSDETNFSQEPDQKGGG
jgi:hypothetical protein